MPKPPKPPKPVALSRNPKRYPGFAPQQTGATGASGVELGVGVGLGVGLGLGLGLPAPPLVPKVHHPVTLTLLAVQVTLSLSLTLLMVQVRDHSSTELDRTRCTHATPARGRATPARTEPPSPDMHRCTYVRVLRRGTEVVCTTVRYVGVREATALRRTGGDAACVVEGGGSEILSI